MDSKEILQMLKNAQAKDKASSGTNAQSEDANTKDDEKQTTDILQLLKDVQTKTKISENKNERLEEKPALKDDSGKKDSNRTVEILQMLKDAREKTKNQAPKPEKEEPVEKETPKKEIPVESKKKPADVLQVLKTAQEKTRNEAPKPEKEPPMEKAAPMKEIPAENKKLTVDFFQMLKIAQVKTDNRKDEIVPSAENDSDWTPEPLSVETEDAPEESEYQRLEIPSRDDSVLGGIEKSIPVYDDRLYVSKIYFLYRKLYDNPDNSEIADEVTEELESRMDNAFQLIEQYRVGDCPSDMVDLCIEICDALGWYYDGLMLFREYVDEGIEEKARNALELIFRGDLLVNEIQLRIAQTIADNPISTLL